MESFKNRLVHGWNAFKNVRQEEETSLPINLGFASSENPSRPRLSMSSEKSIISTVTTRIALDVASFDFQHVKVDQNGRVTALKSGKATVQVTNDSGKTLQCVITVTNKLKSLSFSDKEVSLQGKVDKKLSLVKNPDDADYEKLTWISSNDKVVKVSEDGMVSG